MSYSRKVYYKTELSISFEFMPCANFMVPLPLYTLYFWYLWLILVKESTDSDLPWFSD